MITRLIKERFIIFAFDLFSQSAILILIDCQYERYIECSCIVSRQLYHVALFLGAQEIS